MERLAKIGTEAPRHLRRAIVALGAAVFVLGSSAASAGPVLSSPHYFPATGTGLSPVAVADFNKDGRQDIVVGSVTNHTVSILYGKKGGGFEPPDDHPGGVEPYWISVADFNHDHRPDIAVGSDSAPGTVTVLISKHGGGFQGPHTYTIGDYVQAMAVADFDRDGNPDIATANYSGSFSILLGRRDGTFKHGVTRPTGPEPTGIVASDFDHDHKADMAVLDFGSGLVQVFSGKGNGTFKAPHAFESGASLPVGLVAGRFGDDGNLDLAVADCRAVPNKVYVLAGTHKGTFRKPHGFTNDAESCSDQPAAVDLNRDGRQDIVTSIDEGSHTGDISVLFGRKGGTFSAPRLFPATGPDGNYSVAVGRLNADSRPDLVVPDYSSPRVAVLYGKG